ncbi:hypothetical protein Tco_1152992 [Tanacetum coccineum]
MDEVDIEDLTIEQYLRLTQENQIPKKIKDITIAKYVEYEKKMSGNHISNTKTYLPTYFSKCAPTHDSIREFAHYFGPNQPGAESDCDSEEMEEEVEYMTNDEVVMSEQEKRTKPRKFLLLFIIDDHNLYAITTLEAKDNIMPLDVYKYLGLDKLRDAGTVENTTGTNEPLGAIDILVKFGTLEFLYMAHEEETFNPLEIGIDLFSYESPACLEFEQRSSYDVEEEYAREVGDPYSRRFDEYNRVFKNEIEHLSNEYILRIGKKGYVLDDVWEKCQQNYKKINKAWHDEAYEEDEMWRFIQLIHYKNRKESSYAVTTTVLLEGMININRGLIQAIPTSLPPQPIGEATKASNLQRIPPGVQGRSHFT